MDGYHSLETVLWRQMQNTDESFNGGNSLCWTDRLREQPVWNLGHDKVASLDFSF